VSPEDEAIRRIVERTTRDQGLDLEVKDPVGLHSVAVILLASAEAGETHG
jgi:hypothetical protein